MKAARILLFLLIGLLATAIFAADEISVTFADAPRRCSATSPR